ncbi:sigma-54-dependent Fis family transcriptional regulator [Oxalicibacterium flavum]|uniref:Sigma-54-dependent Fis family transcriptional regulator n=2 Tax=Oxalicibacterium flavum TaxID=179467 RepID=A0A8J2UKJ9_9BURK|nr:sigma-54-dependent Fis family transcriptional regulator [Oxalicibacterium flavum]
MDNDFCEPHSMSSPRILIVDDEADLRELLEMTLIRMGLDVDSAESLAVARRHLQDTHYALVLTDMRLPDGSGIELVQEITANHKQTPVAVITAFGSADNAVAALKAGAFDYLSKPVGLEQLRIMVRSALRISEPPAAHRPGGVQQAQPLRLMGQSDAMQALRAQIARLARSMAPVAISGESGSGKELAARDIHAQSARSDKPFVAVNCGAIPENLMEAEFFGYRKGAFTGAVEDRDGFFQAADGGTLLLDEVADLPLPMQVKLLRAIQERRVRRVGATQEEAVDVRIISATHQDLHACVARGSFRQDLYYRLNVIELHLPPLRERLSDVGMLADAILQRLNGGQPATLTDEALAALQRYAFPGNVRELENILERALAFSVEGRIEAADLLLKGAAVNPAVQLDDDGDARLLQAAAVTKVEEEAVPYRVADDHSVPVLADTELPASLPDHLDSVEREVICRALARTRFNRTQAAELLGISFRQLRYRMQRLNIQAPE